MEEDHAQTAPEQTTPEQTKPANMSPAATAPVDDSFAGFVDTYEGGQEDNVSPSLIEGERLKYSNDSKWTNAQGVELDPQRRFVAIGMERCVAKWSTKDNAPPTKTIVLAAGQPFPNIKAMNDACPTSEWREDPNGKLVGPYQAQRLLYLIDPVSLDKFTFVTATIGGTRALHELADKIAWMQRYRQPGVRPLLRLSSVFMPTRFGGRMRPHFIIDDWVSPAGDSSGGLVHNPTPQIGPGGTVAAKPAARASETVAKAGLKTVSEPSLSEEMSDELRF
jgi:hypothetical protein